MDHAFIYLDYIYKELILFCSFWFLIGSIDDILIDIIFFSQILLPKTKKYSAANIRKIAELHKSNHQGLIAIFVPCWQESTVIAAMLDRCKAGWAASGIEYHIYIGCYPNDPASIGSVIAAARSDPAIRLILNNVPGPTTKADCLNRLWRALLHDELSGGYKAKAIAFHDAEDFIHADELILYDRLIEKAQAVQLPVIPIEVHGSPWISGHYCDEFTEAHAKTMVVRSAIGASVPFAGVGCAIERNFLGRIAVANGNAPFDRNSITEDYELGLHIGQFGGRSIFARYFDSSGDLIGTKSCFPCTIETATRQKSRWIIGIALAGWDRLGWQGGLAEIWMRLHDRRTILSAIVLFASYMCLILSAILYAVQWGGWHGMPQLSYATHDLLIINGVCLFWRMMMRTIFVYKAYDLRMAMLSIPRIFVANIIAIIAARRACFTYFKHMKGQKLIWDKTEHSHFPKAI